ncbi:NEL-type E3 ubiquitin ligase domain-containing protein [Ideonella sp. YS5]|uniref:NEL-type E3 ubiquitin ligase domain-containing protein n=1 Tax=Ideonella sp. YS5 TaxID=3453714 RepID=UPI003EEB2951
MPRPADLIRVLELIPQQPHPAFEALVLRACEEMLTLMGSSEELLQALDERYAGNPVLSHAIDQLMNHILAIEDFSGVSHSHGSEESDGLQDDVEQQQIPLGEQIRAWDASLETRDFDNEPNARPFARLLARLLERRDEGSSSSAAEQLTLQVASVIRAIAADADLRAQVFQLAESALGSCTDNLSEGFSNILLAVNNHQMFQAVESGSVGEVQLHHWAGQQLRLSLLESAVNRFIADSLQRPDLSRAQKENLKKEPLETMVHAKVALRERLDLPESTVSSMTFRTCSVLTQGDLEGLARQVVESSADPATRNAFLLGNATWRAGMRAAHPQAFADLARERDEDPFHDLDLPSPNDEVAQIEYAGLAREVEAKWARREDELLLALAAANEKRPAPG